jgi:H/ACA ribonucleoprotein complex subunit 1
MGPPATVLEMGKFIHACEGEMVVESTNPKVPHFNAPIYLENKVRLPPTSLVFLPISDLRSNRRQSAKSTKSSAR